MGRTDWKRAGWLAAYVLAGVVGMAAWTAATSLYADLKFLHLARVVTEQQRAQPAPVK